MYTSKSYILSRLLPVFVAALALGFGSCSAGRRPLSAYTCFRVSAADEGSKADRRWASYLEGQLVNRAAGDNRPILGDGGDGCLDVVLHVDGSLGSDYKARLGGGRLSLTARDDAKMLWLVYQFIASCPPGVVASADLPPAYVPMDGGEGTFAFEYRGVYTPSNADPELMPILAAGNVDYDWALWGHNLGKLFKGGVPLRAQALAGGRRTPRQFCFSSEELYKAVEAFVVDYGGDASPDETARFAVMPADNGLVCQCPLCLEAGNTATSATPAVSRMLRRLAERFPRCTFFTSSYHTTAAPPARPMPANVGVLVSAIGVPMRAGAATLSGSPAFAALVGRWRKVVGKVYVWDYMRNYDDYFTPYPCLALLQERLRFFRSLGVSGVFYNGSSPYYASFDDVQTAALAALMVNPDLPVAAYADSCFSRYYPSAGPLLARHYGAWERAVVSRRAVLPFYGGIDDAVKAWLSPGDYVAYCDSLDRLSKRAAPAERARLNRLLTATWFTRLQLLRPGSLSPAAKAEARRCVDGLGGCDGFADMACYRETGGSIDQYIAKWKEELR